MSRMSWQKLGQRCLDGGYVPRDPLFTQKVASGLWWEMTGEFDSINPLDVFSALWDQPDASTMFWAAWRDVAAENSHCIRMQGFARPAVPNWYLIQWVRDGKYTIPLRRNRCS